MAAIRLLHYPPHPEIDSASLVVVIAVGVLRQRPLCCRHAKRLRKAGLTCFEGYGGITNTTKVYYVGRSTYAKALEPESIDTV